MAAPSPQPHIPLAYLPRLVGTASLSSMSFGSAGLLLLLGLDVWRSMKKNTRWIPGDSLVLGALSLQFLGLVYRPVISISDAEGLNQEVVNLLFDKIHNNQLLVLGERVVTCVFIGILLPGVAGSSRKSLWSDIFSVAIIATVRLIHISYETYIVVIKNSIDHHNFYSNYWTASFLTSNILIFISILLLVLLLGCAALASESIQEVLAQRIPVLSSKEKYRSPGSAVLSEAFEEQVVCSYIMARTYQPQYIIARSVLISSTGFLVTLCIPFSIVASAKNGFIPENDGFDDVRLIALVLQWGFILFGWLLICWRWITAVVYYPRLKDKKGSGLMECFHVEDFWKRAILELQEKFIQCDINSIKRLSFLNRNLFIFVLKLRLYKLLPAFLYLQILLVLMSKTCWSISEMIFSNRYMRRLLMGRDSVLYDLYSNGQVGGPAIPKEFVKYLEASMQMPGENPAGVWIANRKPIEKMKARLKEGESDGKNCEALISFLEKKTTQDLRFADPFEISFPKLQVERDFNVGKSSAKMTAVSLLVIIIELSGFYDGSPATDDCIKACWEAWEIMEFVENSDTEAAFVNKQADRLFHRLKESRRWLGIALPVNNYNSEERSVEAVKRALQCLAKKAEQMANRGCICSTGYDSKNWEEIIGGNSLYNLCETIKMRSDNIDEILNFVQNWLADIIGSCVLKVEKIIMEECRLWAETFMEEELWDAFYLAGKARGVSRHLPLESTSLQL